MEKKLNFKSSLSYVLYDYLNQLSKDELKKFYLILVHYWNDYKYFISPQSFLRFWIRVNGLCYMIDKDFPNPRKKSKTTFNAYNELQYRYGINLDESPDNYSYRWASHTLL